MSYFGGRYNKYYLSKVLVMENLDTRYLEGEDQWLLSLVSWLFLHLLISAWPARHLWLGSDQPLLLPRQLVAA